MLKNRLIACLLWRDGCLIQSRNFKHTNAVGNAFVAVEFFNTWAIDEIVILNVTRGEKNKQKFIESIKELSRRCFVPLAVGGFIESVDDMRDLLNAGADKIVINSKAFTDNELIQKGASMFGNQCIIVSIDSKKIDGEDRVFIQQGSLDTGFSTVEWAKKASDLGAGEIFLTSIDNDGSLKGYDIDLIASVSDSVNIPVIASGGVGKWEHFAEGIIKGKADAVSAANIFHYSEQSTKKAKNFMKDAGINVREPSFYPIKIPRRPVYNNY